jgi:hypothetical protein
MGLFHGEISPTISSGVYPGYFVNSGCTQVLLIYMFILFWMIAPPIVRIDYSGLTLFEKGLVDLGEL